MTVPDFIYRTNYLSTLGIPFFFMIDFEMEMPIVCRLGEVAKHHLFFNINGITNSLDKSSKPSDIILNSQPIGYRQYLKAFDSVQQNLNIGNTYLLNLTFPTPLDINLGLEDIFRYTSAPYKLSHPDFVVFSPECFIKIIDGHIYSFPMKGTIDAMIPNAEEIILQNQKEIWEHNTIVDLIRNDLSMVSTNVEVTRFRHFSKIKTHKGELLQVSSTIKGNLRDNWKNQLGDIIIQLLPAGSVSGAPKKKTLEIISKVEGEKRGFYTGVFGIFDGNNLDSAVMIRFIEKKDNGLQFRSGGGITALSNPDDEYQELLDKVYVPII